MLMHIARDIFSLPVAQFWLRLALPPGAFGRMSYWTNGSITSFLGSFFELVAPLFGSPIGASHAFVSKKSAGGLHGSFWVDEASWRESL